MSKPRRRRRTTKEALARRRFVIGLLLFLLALAAAIVWSDAARRYVTSEPPPVPLSADAQPDSAADALTAAAEPVVYPYSVIDGGARTVEELRNAIAADPVVATHYASFSIEKTRVERLHRPRLAHVSYRVGNSVFWTRHPVLVKAGETVLTDGVHVARTRCGNQLADEPGDVSPMEPAPGAMDVPARTAAGSVSPLALLRPPTSLPTGFGGSLSGGAGGSLPSIGGLAGAPGSSGAPVSGGASIGGGIGGAVIGTESQDKTSQPSENPEGASDPPGPSPAPPGLPESPSPKNPGPTPPIQTELPLPPFVPEVPRDWTPPPVGSPKPGDVPPGGDPGSPVDPPGTPVDPPGTPVDPPVQPLQPVTVPEPGTAFLLAGGVAYALRRLRAARR